MNQKESNVERKSRSAFFCARSLGDRRRWTWMAILLFNLTVIPGLESRSLHAQQKGTPSQDDITQWIKELSHASFLIRNRAKTNLKKAGEKAFSQLYRARNSEDLETRLTVQELLTEIEVIWVWEDDTKEVEEMMLDFQFRKIDDRLALVDRLSWLGTAECWSALFRIMIYDQSELVSERAAARLMEIVFLRDSPFDSEVVEDYLHFSHAYGVTLKDGEKLGQQICDASFEAVRSSQGLGLKNTFLVRAIDTLDEIVENAKSEFQKTNRINDSLFLQIRSIYSITEVVADSRKFRRLGEVDEKLMKLVEIESGKPLLNDEYLIRLVRILFDNKRWDAARKLFSVLDLKQHGLVFGFMKAELFNLTNDRESAKKVATEMVSRIESVAELLTLFEELDNRRLKQSAIDLVESGLGAGKAPVSIQIRLAEIYFDVNELKKSQTVAQSVLQNSGEFDLGIRACWVLSRISRTENDSSSEISWLEQLLKLDPLSAVALVRLNSLKTTKGFDQTWLQRKISIAKGAFRDEFRLGSQMSQSSTPAEENLGKVKMAHGANSLAWLLAHLNENPSEAQKMASIAVGLEPRNPNYLDTLAFCEFKQGNRKSAISLQKRAVYLSPDNRELKKRLGKYLDQN